MKKSVTIPVGFAGILLSGMAAVWGACLMGHEPGAGYPFPDVKGAVLFVLGFAVVPFFAILFAPLVRRVIANKDPSFRLPASLAILIFAPLLSLAIGVGIQSSFNKERAKEQAFYDAQRKWYARYAARVSDNPGIVLRERWYANDDLPPIGPAISARRMVFRHSFQRKHLSVPYTGAQLRELYDLGPSDLVVCHPECPPDLIEKLWVAALSGNGRGISEQLIRNPATPRHLLEEYLIQHENSAEERSSWIYKAIEKHLSQESER